MDMLRLRHAILAEKKNARNHFRVLFVLARRPSGRRDLERDKGPTRLETQTLEQVRHATQHAQKNRVKVSTSTVS